MLRAALLGTIAIASFAIFYAVLSPARPPSLAQQYSEAVAVETAAAPVLPAGELRPAASDPDERVALAFQLVRDVTPPDVTAPPPASSPPTRISPSESAAPQEAPQRSSERLYNPLIASAGAIVAGGRRINLAGVHPPTFAERCGEAAAAWPCGRMARAALRRFVRGRAIDCEIPAGEAAIPDPAVCRLGGQDLSEWLVAHGWAKNAGGYFEAEQRASSEKLGLWADARPDAQAADVAASSPARAREINARVSSIP
jgi:endonuclease YncB( thermonuclease family)